MLRKGRMKALPTIMEQRLEALTPEDRAAALIQAVAYCLDLRLKPDPGPMFSAAVLQPGDLPEDACEILYWPLEDLYVQASRETISGAELRAVASRHGKQPAADYKAVTEQSFKHVAIGHGILLTRLSFRLGQLRAKVNLSHVPSS